LSAVEGSGGKPPPYVRLTDIGKIVEVQLLDLPNRFPGIAIDKYVIMPNHIHAIVVIASSATTAGQAPTLR